MKASYCLLTLTVLGICSLVVDISYYRLFSLLVYQTTAMKFLILVRLILFHKNVQAFFCSIPSTPMFTLPPHTMLLYSGWVEIGGQYNIGFHIPETKLLNIHFPLFYKNHSLD